MKNTKEQKFYYNRDGIPMDFGELLAELCYLKGRIKQEIEQTLTKYHLPLFIIKGLTQRIFNFYNESVAMCEEKLRNIKIDEDRQKKLSTKKINP